MYFKTTYEQEFDDLYMYLKAKYPDKLFDLEGIGEQTDMGKFSKKFFSTNTSTTADVSVDANSNVDDLTVVAYENELPKPFERLNSLYLLWKYGRQLFGQEYANKMVEKELTGEYYINDMSCVQKSYCFNFSCYDVMTKGLPFVKKINSQPPKHLSSFCGQMIHFTSYASNQVLGAVGLADLLVVMSYYVKKEFDENPDLSESYIWNNVKQEIQSLIYSMNQPFRGGLQSGFYNVSVYDSYFLDTMINDYIFPDGSSPDKEIVVKLQDIFLDTMNETMEISPITFPVTTACFCIDKERNILDKNFLEYIAKKNKKWAFINIYAGESSTLSSCCFSKSTKFYTRKGIKRFIDFKDGDEVEVVSKDNQWRKATVKYFGKQDTNKIYFQDITSKQIKTVIATKDHRWVLKDGTVTQDLKIFEELYQIYPSKKRWVVKNIIPDKNQDVWCVVEPVTETFLLANEMVTGNCRLRSNKNNEYLGYVNSFGSGGTQIGSFGVVTLNLPHIALVSKGNKEKFFEILKENAEYAIRINHTKRFILQKRINLHALPLYDHGFMTLQKQYATIGLNGVYECIEIMGMDILEKDGQDFCEEILTYINNMNDSADAKYKYAHNCEQTPKICGRLTA